MLSRWMEKLWPFGRRRPSPGNLPAGGGKPGTGSGQGSTTGDRPAISGQVPTGTQEGNTQGTGSGPAAPGISSSDACASPSRLQRLTPRLPQGSGRSLGPNPYHQASTQGPPRFSSNPNPSPQRRPDDDSDALLYGTAAVMGATLLSGNNAAAAAAAASVVGCNGSSGGADVSGHGGAGGVGDSCAADPSPNFSGGGGDSGGAGSSGGFDSGGGS